MQNWDFNLRRSNLALAVHAEEKGGFILVDSTRRGKVSAGPHPADGSACLTVSRRRCRSGVRS